MAFGIRAEQIERIVNATHHDPFSVLGYHPGTDYDVVRVFAPHVETASISHGDQCLVLSRIHPDGLFEWQGPASTIHCPYVVHMRNYDGEEFRMIDPYGLPPVIESEDLGAFANGAHNRAYRFLGAQPQSLSEVDGVHFAVWAPNAARVSVVGDFNAWDGRRHTMRVRGDSGVWELFVPALEPGAIYKYEIRNRHDGLVHLRADPYARQAELRPRTASVVCSTDSYTWHDADWLDRRAECDWLHAPLSIYEVHLGSWRRDTNDNPLGYRHLASELVDYVRSMGYTHIQLLPIAEHPFDGSWGYQTLGYFAPSARFGAPDDLRFLVDQCHQHNIGVLLDWTPAHFPNDTHGLACFDGTALYEHADVQRGKHPDWDTLIFNYGRNEVRSFLLSSAHYWIEEFHFDGLRVDAVASMLYLDYSRKAGEWVANQFGGNENLEAVEFLRTLNTTLLGTHPGVLTIAEESTSWPMVSRPTYVGGLGFSMKWNMGWMNDTLTYVSNDPVHRKFHHDYLTFGLLYAFTENFVLPLSHDEVVHGKGSLLEKMPGDDWQRFANVRLLFAYLFCMPGKKHLFMGNDFAQRAEWNHDQSLDWHLLEHDEHCGIQALVRDLNDVYRQERSLHSHDFDAAGFSWLDCHDSGQSVISFTRQCDDDFVVVVLNFTPVPRHDYRIGVPVDGTYRELINSDSHHYGGSNLGNSGAVISEPVPWMGQKYSLSLTLPPLAGIVLRHDESQRHRYE